MKTILEVLNSGADYLSKQGCDEARAVMQHLMAHVLHCNRTYLYTHFDEPLSEQQLTPLRDLLKRKAAGEPLQHILGTTEFYRREFLSDARALVPRPETEELVDLVGRKLDTANGRLRLLDMGTGSGIIGITLALELGDKASSVVLADISPKALSLALENALRLGAKVATRETDLFSAMDAEEPFDAIVANLPYIPNGETLQREVHFDPASALYGGVQGWEIIERFLKEAPRFLKHDGFIALEIGHDQSGEVDRILRSLHYQNIEIARDISGIARFPFAVRPLSPDPIDHANGQGSD